MIVRKRADSAQKVDFLFVEIERALSMKLIVEKFTGVRALTIIIQKRALFVTSSVNKQPFINIAIGEDSLALGDVTIRKEPTRVQMRCGLFSSSVLGKCV